MTEFDDWLATFSQERFEELVPRLVNLRGYLNWSHDRAYKLVVSVVRHAYNLKEETGEPFSFRSAVYRMSDAGEIPGSTVTAMSINLNHLVSGLRDLGAVPWGLFADDSGDDYRGMTPDELEEAVAAARENNVVPLVVSGALPVIMVEKSGLVTYLQRVTRGAIPVGSSGGQLNKEWAHSWVVEIVDLANRLDAVPRLVYLGDGEPPSTRGQLRGWGIRDTTIRWIEGQFGLTVESYAVTEQQVADLGLTELHLDGWIARDPTAFGCSLRAYLGIEPNP